MSTSRTQERAMFEALRAVRGSPRSRRSWSSASCRWPGSSPAGTRAAPSRSRTSSRSRASRSSGRSTASTTRAGPPSPPTPCPASPAPSSATSATTAGRSGSPRDLQELVPAGGAAEPGARHGHRPAALDGGGRRERRRGRRAGRRGAAWPTARCTPIRSTHRGARTRTMMAVSLLDTMGDTDANLDRVRTPRRRSGRSRATPTRRSGSATGGRPTRSTPRTGRPTATRASTAAPPACCWRSIASRRPGCTSRATTTRGSRGDLAGARRSGARPVAGRSRRRAGRLAAVAVAGAGGPPRQCRRRSRPTTRSSCCWAARACCCSPTRCSSTPARTAGRPRGARSPST